jgi:hypothetical protein
MNLTSQKLASAMSRRIVVSGTTLSALLMISAVVSAAPDVVPPSCVFETYAPSSVVAYNAEETVGYGTHPVLRGAQLYVQAREGLTKEWLELSVQRAFAVPAMESNSCRPEVRDIEVSVSSAGPGFWVYLGSGNLRSARALLQWAQTRVTPEQSPPIPPANKSASR